MTLAEQTKTVLHQFDGRMTVFDTDGKVMASDEAQEIFEATWGIIQKAFEYSDKEKDNIDPSLSLYDFFKEQAPKFTSDPRKQSKILDMSHEWGAFVGDPVTKQSLKFFFLESTIEGGPTISVLVCSIPR